MIKFFIQMTKKPKKFINVVEYEGGIWYGAVV